MCNTTLNKEIQKKYFVKYALNNLLLATNLNLVIPITLQSDGINLWYLKLWVFYLTEFIQLKGVFAKNERGYRRNAKNKRFWSLQILLLSVASIRRKLVKTTYTEERRAHTNSESCNIRLGS